jgi:hypothetical protein
MKIARTLIVLALLQGPSAAFNAVAQVPPHIPGTICFTPQFWCWMGGQGQPGTICYCTTPYGPVQGRLG